MENAVIFYRIFCGNLEYFPFVLVHCVKKNLATLTWWLAIKNIS
jgi:hypothetical protein